MLLIKHLMFGCANENSLVMGDFIINSLNHEMRLILDHALCGYELVVNDATHLIGAIIDHIYI